jgi:hypothetical protein
VIKLGLIADTHIPDRVPELPAWTLDAFQQANVDTILHLGDISKQFILDQLAEVAPVLAVRGNLDFWGFNDLPMHRHLDYEGVRIGVTHGHMSFLFYLFERIYAQMLGPYKAAYFERKALRRFPDTDVIVFGHNHLPTNRMVGEQLLFNPGSATWPNPFYPDLKPSIGLLHIDTGVVRGEFIYQP